MRRFILTLIALFAMTSILAAQPAWNTNTQIYGSLEYEIGIDDYTYSHGETMEIYFMITNVTDSTVSFDCPSSNFCLYRVTLGDTEIDLFPESTLPMILNVTLRSGESKTDSTTWITTPADRDTTYRLWGILNVSPSWSPMPRESLFVEFTIGDETGIAGAPRAENEFTLPNPLRADFRLDTPGVYDIFDISGRRLRTIRAGNRVGGGLPDGLYFIRKRGDGECRKTVILN